VPARPEPTPSGRAREATDGGGNARNDRRGNGSGQQAAPEPSGPASKGATPRAAPTTRPDAGRPPAGAAPAERRPDNGQRGPADKGKGPDREDDEPGKGRGKGG
jgi:hypothetical protein